MLHACVQTFDVTENLEKFWELNMAIYHLVSQHICFLLKNACMPFEFGSPEVCRHDTRCRRFLYPKLHEQTSNIVTIKNILCSHTWRNHLPLQHILRGATTRLSLFAGRLNTDGYKALACWVSCSPAQRN
jgi:hypothetical protein